jgi:hypothetical protein
MFISNFGKTTSLSFEGLGEIVIRAGRHQYPALTAEMFFGNPIAKILSDGGIMIAEGEYEGTRLREVPDAERKTAKKAKNKGRNKRASQPIKTGASIDIGGDSKGHS